MILSDSVAATISCNFALVALAATTTSKLVFDFYLNECINAQLLNPKRPKPTQEYMTFDNPDWQT